MPPDFQLRQSGEYRCIDCLRDILTSDDEDTPGHSKPSNYLMSGDSVCVEHAKKRLVLLWRGVDEQRGQLGAPKDPPLSS